jgi:hypothetical protein
VRDFIAAGISWRNVVRARFAASSQVTDAEIDRALGPRLGHAPASLRWTMPRSPSSAGVAAMRCHARRPCSNRVDTCDDLYGVRPEGLERQVLPPSEIPQDIAAALSRLDPDEMSFDVTRGQGTLLLVTMLCGRSAARSPKVPATKCVSSCSNSASAPMPRVSSKSFGRTRSSFIGDG